MVKLLLDNSAYIDAASPDGTTPLMMAARGGYVSTVNLLLDEDADVTLKNQLGLDAADFARRYDESDAARLLSARLAARAPGAGGAASGAAAVQNHAQ